MSDVCSSDLPEAADPEAIGRSLVTRLRERTISPAELQFAMAMLGRHEAAAKGRAIAIRGGRATAAPTDAVLTQRPDTLARPNRPEDPRVGEGGVSTCRTRWPPAQ